MKRQILMWICFSAAFVALLFLCLFTGTVDIPVGETLKVLSGGESVNPIWTGIISELRVPMTLTALLTGAALGIAGLLLQTTFNNPLAGPSVLGVSTGASLGVALVLLAFPIGDDMSGAAIFGASVGAAMVIMLLLGFSTIVKSAVMLLIIGLMLSYLGSSAVSFLNFYATQEGVHSYVIWGLGNFTGVGTDALGLYAFLIIVLCLLTFLLVKPMNALLLGHRYAADIGTNVKTARTSLLFVSGALIAVTTAFCGPIGFIGLAVPHIARLLWRTSNHRILVPAVIMTGAVTGLLTLWFSILPGDRGMLPVNAITPLIGVPVVFYIILNRKRVNYLS